MQLNTQIFIAIFLFFGVSCYGQICESFNRKLFSLSEEIPNQINCKDSLGRKQGWWIYYKIQYNPEESTELNVGDYVPDYDTVNTKMISKLTLG